MRREATKGAPLQKVILWKSPKNGNIRQEGSEYRRNEICTNSTTTMEIQIILETSWKEENRKKWNFEDVNKNTEK